MSDRPPARKGADAPLALTLTGFARHLTRAQGITLHWAEIGSGVPLVMLHGVCDSHRTWRRVAPALARTHRVLMPDLPGHGLSDRPDAPYTVPWYAEIIGAWIDALKLEAFDLVGHSFGGGVAQYLLLTFGARIRRLALVAPGGLGKEVSLGLRLWSMADSIEKVAQPLMAQSTRLGMSALLPDADPEDIAFLSWMNAMPGTARALSRTVSSAIDWRGQKQRFYDRAHELSELPPIRLYWGDKDPIVPASHAEEMTSRLDHVSVVLFDRCGHFPHQEKAAEFAIALTDFLGDRSLEAALVHGRERVVVRRASRVVTAWRALVLWIQRGIVWLAVRLGRKTNPKLPDAR